MVVKIIIALIVLFIIILISSMFIGNFFYNLALNSKTSKDSVFESKNNIENDGVKKDETSGENKKADRDWILYESGYKDAYLKSYDNLKLHAYEFNNSNNNHKYAVVIHGYNGQAVFMGSRIKKFISMGYSVIAPDLRGHGLSEGKYIGMGWHDRKDILAWIRYILSKDKDAKIVLYGISMGAATVMMTCGEKLPGNVKAAVEDCGYSSVWDQFSATLKHMFKLPDFPVMYIASFVAKIRAGYYFKDASAIKAIEKCKIPMLFIHGSEDKFVPFEMLDKIYQKAGCPKERLVVEGAKHCESNKLKPELYWKTVKDFVDKYI